MNEDVGSATTLSLRSPASAPGKGGAPTELEKARAETERLRAEAAAARETAEQARAKMLRASRNSKLRWRTTAVVMMTAALLKLGWQAAHAPAPVPTVAQPLPPSAAAMSVRSSDKTTAGEGAADHSEGALALERLRDAFHSFPEEDQMDVVREINEKHAADGRACPLAWNADGVPALSVGGKTGAVAVSMAAALNQCASEVEKLRIEKNAEARR